MEVQPKDALNTMQIAHILVLSFPVGYLQIDDLYIIISSFQLSFSLPLLFYHTFPQMSSDF